VRTTDGVKPSAARSGKDSSARSGNSNAEKRENRYSREKRTNALPQKKEERPVREPEKRISLTKEADLAAEESSRSIYKYSAACSRCAKETKISFPPDGIRPVFCKDCLVQIKKEKNEETEARKRKKQEELQRLEERDNGRREEPEKRLKLAGLEDGSWQEITLSDLKNIAPIKFGQLKKNNSSSGEENRPGSEKSGSPDMRSGQLSDGGTNNISERPNSQPGKKIRAGETVKF
jgi:CxxC-x17-CxxC domain-containing protein